MDSLLSEIWKINNKQPLVTEKRRILSQVTADMLEKNPQLIHIKLKKGQQRNAKTKLWDVIDIVDIFRMCSPSRGMYLHSCWQWPTSKIKGKS